MGSAKAEFNDAQYVKDLRGAFSSVPKPKARWQDRYLKLMIVGETGQGDCCGPCKSQHTFILFYFAVLATLPVKKQSDVNWT